MNLKHIFLKKIAHSTRHKEPWIQLRKTQDGMKYCVECEVYPKSITQKMACNNVERQVNTISLKPWPFRLET